MTRPRVLSVSLDSPEQAVIDAALETLESGGLLLYPSDTVYGIMCRAGRKDSADRLARLKGYPGPRPFITLLPDIERALALAEADAGALRLAGESWPGPVTLVLPAGPAVPPWMKAADGTVALRVPADPLSRAILTGAGCPMSSTSANVAGEEPPRELGRVVRQILQSVDCALDGGALRTSGPSRILRPGPSGIEVLRG